MALSPEERARYARHLALPEIAAEGQERLKAARERARRELEEISDRIARTVGRTQAAIFAAQLLMLDDPLLAGAGRAGLLLGRLKVPSRTLDATSS